MEKGADKNFDKDEWSFFVTVLKEEARTAIWEVGSEVDPKTLVESVLQEIAGLAPGAEEADNRSKEQIWQQIRELLVKAAYATRPYCIRCGKCCTAGSPTLTPQDMELFVKDVIGPGHVFTVRKGESAYSPLTRQVAQTEQEIIKIREKPFTKICIFFDEKEKACTIYDSRPTQCRVQECWNPDGAEAIAQLPRLGREAVLEPTGSLWELIQRHEQRCSYDELNRAITRLGATKGQTVQEMLDLLSLDHEVRRLVAQRFELAPETMDFFFGRPLQESIVAYGLKVVRQADGSFLLTPLDSGPRR